MDMDMKSTGTVGAGYNSHTRAVLYCPTVRPNNRVMAFVPKLWTVGGVWRVKLVIQPGNEQNCTV